jgi:predicted DNA-binding transcriptional regulator
MYQEERRIGLSHALHSHEEQAKAARAQPEILMRIDGIKRELEILERDTYAYVERLVPISIEKRVNTAGGINNPVIAKEEPANTELSQMLLSIQLRIEALRTEIRDATSRLAV